MYNYYLYILKSEKDGNLYVGVTSNLDRRLNEHNSGKVRSTTGRRPFHIVYSEKFDTLSAARKKEWQLKCTPAGGKLKKKLGNMAPRS